MAENLAILKGRKFLLGVGAQKAGTTWLYDYLWQHPQVFISPVKEMHFFGNRECGDGWPVTMFRKKLRTRAGADQTGKRFHALRDRIAMKGDITRYRRFFRKRVTDEPVFGEITPAYSKLTVEELSFVRGQFPRTRVIFLMRNPVDRLWSQMRFSEKFETVADLEARLDAVFEEPAYLERLDYRQTITNLREVFPPAALHFEFYERLFTPQAVSRICGFLGIDPRPANFDKTLNVSVKMPLSPLLRPHVAGQLRDQYHFVDDAFDGDLPDAWKADIALLR